MSNQLPDPAVLECYKRYRSASIELFSKIHAMYLSDREILETGKRIGLLSADTKKMAQQQWDIISEYLVFEQRDNSGHNLVDRYVQKFRAINEIEKELLSEMQAARPSLYNLIEANPHKKTVLLYDLIKNDFSILTDIGFSESNIPETGVILFLRPLHFEAFSMSTGVSFIYPLEQRTALLRCWKELEDSDSQDVFCVYMRKYLRSPYQIVRP